MNGFGRVVLIAAGMPVEDIVGPGMYGMQLCSFVYDKVYNFKLANFENDLISRWPFLCCFSKISGWLTAPTELGPAILAMQILQDSVQDSRYLKQLALIITF